MKTKDIRVRDPFVVVYEGKYYMYKSDRENNRVIAYISDDLENWNEQIDIYEVSEASWGCGYNDLWAPEVHFYNGKYYMFVTLMGKNGLRGTEICVCDTPCGCFVPLTDKAITPENKSCIDGTLYVENDIPYIVYSADWPDNYNEEKDCYIGEIWALQLSNDLKKSEGEPFLLFRSDEAACAKEPNKLMWGEKIVERYGSDGPYLLKLTDGTLYITWSPYPGDTYIVAAAISENGSIKGKWKHLSKPLFDGHGGHAMFFDDLDGNKKMCLHCPQIPPNERALFIDVIEEDGMLKVIE